MWQLFEVLHFVAIWMRLYSMTGPDKTSGFFPDWIFSLAVLGHIVSLGVLMFLVIRCIFQPDEDPVRRVGLDDPLGGLFASPEPASRTATKRATASASEDSEGAPATVGASARHTKESETLPEAKESHD